MNRFSEEEMEGITVCDKVYLGVVLICSLLFYDKCQSSLVGDTAGERIYDN